MSAAKKTRKQIAEVNVDKEKAMPYPIEDVQSDWDNIQDNVRIERRIEEL